MIAKEDVSSGKHATRIYYRRFFFGVAFLFLFAMPLHASVELLGPEGVLKRPANKDFTATADGYWGTDFVASKNTIDLDSKAKKDSFGYIGLVYRLNLDLKYKDDVEVFFGFERSGPFIYDTPVLGRKSVPTIYGNAEHYRNRELLPELREVYLDTKVPGTGAYPVHFKFGLYPYSVGNGYAVNGLYDNYGFGISHPGENLAWNFNYFKPDWSNRVILGPVIPQEKFFGRGDFHNQADLFILDAVYQWKKSVHASWVVPEGSLQPYISFLSDRTGTLKRANLFETQTHQDLLGTLGADLKLQFGLLSMGFEAARNFGKAVATTGDQPVGATVVSGDKDIIHEGYMLCVDAALDLKKYWLTPRSKLLVASGNKSDDSSDGLLHGSTNRAFSVYSPTNTHLGYSVYPSRKTSLPLLAMAYAAGNNYGVLRPGTFNDPAQVENLIAPDVGFDVTPHPKVKLSFDWWHLTAFEQALGSFNGESVKLSRDLGNEIDLNAAFDVTKYLTLSCAMGYFIPGDYYKVERNDGGTTFSPQVTGGGSASNAIYFESRIMLKF